MTPSPDPAVANGAVPTDGPTSDAAAAGDGSRGLMAPGTSVRPSMSLLRRVTRRVARSVGRARRDLRRALQVLTDPGARPAVLYLLALGAAGASFLLFLVSDRGTPDGVEFGLLIGSFGVVVYMSLRQAGTAPRRGR